MYFVLKMVGISIQQFVSLPKSSPQQNCYWIASTNHWVLFFPQLMKNRTTEHLHLWKAKNERVLKFSFPTFRFCKPRKISSASSASERCCSWTLSWLVQRITLTYPMILEPNKSFIRPYSMVADRPLLTHIKRLFLGTGYIRGVVKRV